MFSYDRRCVHFYFYFYFCFIYSEIFVNQAHSNLELFVYSGEYLNTLFSFCVCVQLFSHVQLFATPWTLACQASLSMEFYRQKTAVGCHFLLHGIIPTQGSKLYLVSCIAGRFFITVPLGKPLISSDALFQKVSFFLTLIQLCFLLISVCWIYTFLFFHIQHFNICTFKLALFLVEQSKNFKIHPNSLCL